MSIQNLLEARTSRRRIVDQLKKQQIEDSYCADKLTQLVLDSKKKLLTLLAEWLTTFGANKQLVDGDRNVLANITSQQSMENWLAAQSHETDLIEQSIQAKEAEEKAHKIYKRAVPHGRLSIPLKNEGEKVKAKRLQREYELAKKARVSIEDKLCTVRKDIRKMIGRFLRDFLNSESLIVLARESSIKEELKALSTEVEHKAIELWRPLSSDQLSSLRELERETMNLSNFHSKAPVIKAEKLLS